MLEMLTTPCIDTRLKKSGVLKVTVTALTDIWNITIPESSALTTSIRAESVMINHSSQKNTCHNFLHGMVIHFYVIIHNTQI